MKPLKDLLPPICRCGLSSAVNHPQTLWLRTTGLVETSALQNKMFGNKPGAFSSVSLGRSSPSFKNAQTGGVALFGGGRSFLFFRLFALLFRLLLTFDFRDRAGRSGVYLQAH